MANLSDAHGTIFIPSTLVANHPEELIKLIQAMEKELSTTEYCTELTQDYALLCNKIHYSTIPRDLKLDFYGTGRWSYYSNVRHFFESLFPERVKAYNLEWVQTLFQEDDAFIEFSFFDYEPGADFLYEAYLQIRPNIQNQTITTEIIQESYEDFPITASNLMTHHFYEQAYDAHNAHELLQNEAFMIELCVFIPRQNITATFLTDAWKEYVIYVYDGEAIFDQVLSDIVDYYHSIHPLALAEA
ncbi:hypothetical protein HCA69_15465 [Listeria grandensis]|uniref:Uncharacterized protein n=1 Tax=Listeria grandensis TaxID=1494963 RepID=A0A7X0Y667_9LIST|nr:hypothetical protein [Listeria grandensis]MBC1937767.1 hypothetical protein [Listeria grandensis]